MKKNILTIIVMAVSIVNLVLGIVLVFSIVPASNKTAALVDKVASVIDLNIDDPNSEEQDYTIDDLVAYTKTYDSAVNINLKKDVGDDSNHYAQLAGFTIIFFPVVKVITVSGVSSTISIKWLLMVSNEPFILVTSIINPSLLVKSTLTHPHNSCGWVNMSNHYRFRLMSSSSIVSDVVITREFA